jgi:hypothetical protein
MGYVFLFMFSSLSSSGSGSQHECRSPYHLDEGASPSDCCLASKPGTGILHSRADVVPFAVAEEGVRTSDLAASALIEVGTDHQLPEKEPLAECAFPASRM